MSARSPHRQLGLLALMQVDYYGVWTAIPWDSYYHRNLPTDHPQRLRQLAAHSVPQSTPVSNSPKAKPPHPQGKMQAISEVPGPGLRRIGIGLNNCIPWFCFVWDVGGVAFVVL